MEQEIKRLWGTCQMSLMDSKEDCDDAMFGICSDLAIKQVEGVNRIPVAVFSARHSENGFAKAFTSYCQEHGIDESDIESAPLYITNAFKSQWFPQFDRKIRAFVKEKGVKLVILDGCINETEEFNELAAELPIGILALDIRNNND